MDYSTPKKRKVLHCHVLDLIVKDGKDWATAAVHVTTDDGKEFLNIALVDTCDFDDETLINMIGATVPGRWSQSGDHFVVTIDEKAAR